MAAPPPSSPVAILRSFSRYIMDNIEVESVAKRVLVVVSRKSPHWSKAWNSSQELVAIALRIMQNTHLVAPNVDDDPSAITFLAKERWDSRIFIVFDIFHNTCDSEKAHLVGQNDLPVISVFLGQKESASTAGRPLETRSTAISGPSTTRLVLEVDLLSTLITPTKECRFTRIRGHPV